MCFSQCPESTPCNANTNTWAFLMVCCVSVCCTAETTEQLHGWWILITVLTWVVLLKWRARAAVASDPCSQTMKLPTYSPAEPPESYCYISPISGHLETALPPTAIIIRYNLCFVCASVHVHINIYCAHALIMHYNKHNLEKHCMLNFAFAQRTERYVLAAAMTDRLSQTHIIPQVSLHVFCSVNDSWHERAASWGLIERGYTLTSPKLSETPANVTEEAVHASNVRRSDEKTTKEKVDMEVQGHESYRENVNDPNW